MPCYCCSNVIVGLFKSFLMYCHRTLYDVLACYNVCWNNTYRKIFGYKQRESVKLLLCCLQRLDFKRFYDLKRLLFLKRVQSSSNSVIKSVLPFELSSSTNVALLREYKVCLNWNVTKLRHSVINVYCELVSFS